MILGLCQFKNSFYGFKFQIKLELRFFFDYGIKAQLKQNIYFILLFETKQSQRTKKRPVIGQFTEILIYL